jgi:hypothetical protein
MIDKWFQWIGQPKHDLAWHKSDIAEELAEYYEEKRLLKKWSELSDVVFTTARSRWSGYQVEFPLARWQYPLGVLYGLPKFSLRFLFFRSAGKKAGALKPVNAIRNPKKTHKLHAIAEQNGIDKKKFQAICEQQLRYWILLP